MSSTTRTRGGSRLRCRQFPLCRGESGTKLGPLHLEVGKLALEGLQRFLRCLHLLFLRRHPRGGKLYLATRRVGRLRPPIHKALVYLRGSSGVRKFCLKLFKSGNSRRVLILRQLLVWIERVF